MNNIFPMKFTKKDFSRRRRKIKKRLSPFHNRDFRAIKFGGKTLEATDHHAR